MKWAEIKKDLMVTIMANPENTYFSVHTNIGLQGYFFLKRTSRIDQI